MHTPIRPWISNIKLVILYFTLIVMHYNYQSQGHAAALRGTITSAHYQPTRKISKPPATSKWPNLHRVQNPQACGGVRSWSISRRTVPQWANSGTPNNYTPWTRFYPTTNPNKNRQLRGRRHHHRYSLKKKVQGNGYAIWTFCLLESREPKHRGLFHKI